MAKGGGVNKAQLCTHMVKHFATSKLALRRADAHEFLEELRRLCERQLLEVGQFAVPGVAKLVVEHRGARKGRSPVTGAGHRDSGPPGRQGRGSRRGSGRQWSDPLDARSRPEGQRVGSCGRRARTVSMVSVSAAGLSSRYRLTRANRNATPPG